MNIRSLFITVLLVGASSAFLALGASAQADDSHPGFAVYQQGCAFCHGGGNARAPRLGILQAMSADDLRYALTEGLMAEQGSTLSAQDRATVIEYLAAPEVSHEAWIADIRCTEDRRLVDLSQPVAMSRVGVDITASRMISAEASGLSKGDMENLELAWALAFPGVTTLRAAPVIVGSTVFYSAVNTGKLLALDAKIDIDSNGLYRHKDLLELRDTEEEDPLEVEASKYNLNYINLSGNVGNMVNGAGLAMATMDIIKKAGAEPANFLDVGGGANEEMVENGFRIILADENVKAILINIFGGILRCDVLAEGVVQAAQKTGINVPVVIRMEGTNVEEGRKILADSGLNLITAANLKDAADKIAEIVRG